MNERVKRVLEQMRRNTIAICLAPRTEEDPRPKIQIVAYPQKGPMMGPSGRCQRFKELALS